MLYRGKSITFGTVYNNKKMPDSDRYLKMAAMLKTILFCTGSGAELIFWIGQYVQYVQYMLLTDHLQQIQ